MQHRYKSFVRFFLILLFFAPAIGNSDINTQVSVHANQAWTDTGIDLALGSNVTITASGTIRTAGSDPGKTPAGVPECGASSDFVAPGLPCWSLIGRIGTGTPFYVGTATGFSVATSGRLFLGVNDNFFPDNTGSWAATVTATSTVTSFAELSPTEILFNSAHLVPGGTVFFDSGVRNSGSQGTGVFNVRWFVDGVSVGFGSHAGVPGNSTVLDGNSQFSWVATAGTHMITFAVDVDNHVVESDESNNSTSVTVAVTSQAGQSPDITLLGDNPIHLTQGCPLVGAGATATDPEDGDLTDSIIIDGSVDINAPGQYFLTYSVTDSGGLSDTETRQVIVFGVIGTPVCFVGSPAGKAPNLVVLVHGCCTDADDVRNDWDSFGKAIAGAIQTPAPEQWEIVVLDWTKCTSDPNVECTPKPPIWDVPNFITQANTAYTHALIVGRELAVAIATYHYKHVHLIAHSAGAKLIDEAAFQTALNNTDQPFIHLTFIDAYTRDDNDTINYGGFPVGYPHYVEHYVDIGLLSTDACLSNAFNFNISNWDRLSVGERGFGGHQWPHNWYERSVTSTSPKFQYGYTLSLEGSNDRFDELATLHPPGKQCGLDTGLFNENPNPDCQQAACW